MFDRLMNLFANANEPTYALAPSDLHLAVAALLVEAARMDDNFGADERAVIARVLAERFDLSAGEVEDLIARASEEMRDNVQYFPFTHHINTMMSGDEKIGVIEMLWQVAYADGRLDPFEDRLIRQVAGLIYVEDRARMEARRRVLGRDEGAD
ncbi:MAG TPA: TerB family tellurite resistance protein [Hyphomicrobiaceae bacterium]|nr:TerB family tellurite resistance protein [Hyphomicrobiaceae bacterium]